MPIELITIQHRISQSDQTAFRQLFEHFFVGLLSYSKSILRNESLAEEVVEDVFIRLWEHREKITAIRNISFYIYKAVRYASINALEKDNRHKSLLLDDLVEGIPFFFAKSESQLISKENCQKISDAINQLPPRCKLIFRLVKEEGLKYKEVSQLLHLSEKTIENQMNLAFKKLIKTLNRTLPELAAHYTFNANARPKKMEQVES